MKNFVPLHHRGVRAVAVLVVVCLGLLSGALGAFAQGAGPEYSGGIKVKLNDDGSKYIRFITWGQFWLRATENNPGTAVNGSAEETTFDLGLRRARFLAFTQVSKRYLILAHIGINNQTFNGGGATGTSGTGAYGVGKKPQVFFHDFWNEYAVVQEKEGQFGSLYLGAGLHYWMGLSRMTMASTLNFLTIDAPIFNWPLIENSDQFARMFGLYAKGHLGQLEYRMHASRPFTTNQTPALDKAVDNNLGTNPWSFGGYFKYDFFDKESNLLPFYVGTYVGTKKVFNIGAGFYTNADATKSIASAGDTVSHAINLFAVDAFADLPVGTNGGAVTAHTVFYSSDFGPNYLRNVGIMNIGAADPNYTGTVSQNGFGNTRPTIGTGSTWYTQAGFLLPKFSDKVRLQPFAAYTYQDFDALDEAISSFDAGANVFLDGHHAKLTLQYSNRPIIVNNKKDTSKGEWILQFMIYL